jgi:CubicO group peptidase (beta-lactamase class C family)
MEKLKFVSTLLLFGFFATAQDRSATLLQLMKKAGVPGLSLAYIKQGKLQEHYSLGVTSSETRQAVNDSSVFSAASLSKSIFSYAVFGLVREKKLDLDKPLYLYYHYKDVANDTRYKLVTTRMILSHSSGLPNWRDNDSLYFKSTPGEKFNYSSEGMVWLSRVVEAITGKDIETYIREKIFQPLHMTHTSYVWREHFEDNFAYPHIDIGQTMSKQFPSEANVAQSLQTTALDYAKFLVAVLQDKVFMTALQKEPSITVADNLSWGLGFGQQRNKDGMAFWQWGDNGTFKAFLIGYPNNREGLVYFANTFHGLKIAKNILQLFFNREQPSLAWLGTDSVDAPDLQVFETMLHNSVKQAVAPYYLTGKNKVDTSLLSSSKIVYLGNRFIQLRRFDKAIDLFHEGLLADSINENFYAGLMEANLRAGNKEAALNAVLQAAKINPNKTIYQAVAGKLQGKPVAPKSGEKMIVFSLPDYMSAYHVTLVGTFNDWNDLIEPMHWENGSWTISLALPPGIYRYKFVVDGVWLTDTRNPKFTPGSFDSELIVK